MLYAYLDLELTVFSNFLKRKRKSNFNCAFKLKHFFLIYNYFTVDFCNLKKINNLKQL